jgi:PAS domain-containing protein
MLPGMSDLAALPDATAIHRGQTAPARAAAKASARRTPWHSRPIRLIIISGIILVGVVIAATTILLANLRTRDLSEKEHALESLALVLADQIDRSFQSIELVQMFAIERMQNLGVASAEDFERQMSGQDTHQRLKDQVRALPFIDAIVLTDSQGKLINFSRSWPIPTITNADQDPSAAFKANPQLMSFVGKPLRSPANGTWVLPIAHKFTGPNGEFLGVIIGVMQLQYFETVFKSILPDDGSSFSLHLNDGTVVVRYPRIESVIGQAFAGAVQALGDRDHGTIRLIGKMEGKDRLLAAQRLAHFPLFVTVGDDISIILASWRSGAIYMTVAALTIGFVIGGVVLLCIWLVGKKLREQNLQRDTALNNMSQGLVMFDPAARLVVCNDRYRQIYNLPRELTKRGCAVLDLLKYRVANGTFSGDPEKYVADLLATIAHGETATQEVDTGDGRIVTVVNQPRAGNSSIPSSRMCRYRLS